jgi:hypothetical protein
VDDEVPGELLAIDGKVLAEVDAAALFPSEPARRDPAHERVRRVEQAREALAAANEPCLPPESSAATGAVVLS